MAERYRNSKNVYPIGTEKTSGHKSKNALKSKAIDPKKIARESCPWKRPQSEDDKKRRETWLFLVPELVKLGRFKPAYHQFLKEYCIIVVRLEAFREWLELNDWTYSCEGRNGIQWKNYPQVGQLNSDWSKFNSMTGQMGLSPITDERFDFSAPPGAGSPFDEL